MNGMELKQLFLDAIDRPVGDELELSDRAIFTALDHAAAEFARFTRMLKKSATITSVKDQQIYDLPADFISLYAYNGSRRLVVKYTDGNGDVTWPVCSSFEKIFVEDEDEAKATPDRFCIVPRSAAETRLAGTASSAGAVSVGEAALIDSTAAFTTTAEVRDRAHNTTKDAAGLVVAVSSATQVKTVLFGGTGQGWAISDAYVITPGATQQIMLDAPSETAGHTITIPYVRMPPPVFTDYATWPFPVASCRAIVYQAAFHFLNNKRDGKPRKIHHDAFRAEIHQAKVEQAMNLLQGRSYVGRG